MRINQHAGCIEDMQTVQLIVSTHAVVLSDTTVPRLTNLGGL